FVCIRGIGRRTIFRGRGGRDLVQFVFCSCSGGAKTALLLLGTLRNLSGLSRTEGLKLKRPLGGLGNRRDSRTYLDLLVNGLKPEHLDFHRIGARRQTGEFIRAGLVGGGHCAVI